MAANSEPSAPANVAPEPTGKATTPVTPVKAKRVIAGDFSYTTTPGKLKTALDNLVNAERPEVFNKDFIETYLNVSGGSAAPIPNILKRIGFIAPDGRPTDLYAKFQTEGGRADAALEGLKRGFAELFKKNVYAHSLPEDKVKDLVVEITGLKRNDTVVSLIYGTFDAIRSFIPDKFVPQPNQQREEAQEDRRAVIADSAAGSAGFGLSYHINIVLPETKDIAVFNAIFQSLRQNLLS